MPICAECDLRAVAFFFFLFDVEENEQQIIHKINVIGENILKMYLNKTQSLLLLFIFILSRRSKYESKKRGAVSERDARLESNR